VVELKAGCSRFGCTKGYMGGSASSTCNDELLQTRDRDWPTFNLPSNQRRLSRNARSSCASSGDRSCRSSAMGECIVAGSGRLARGGARDEGTAS
jgi:hypothetical protein